MAIVNVTDLSKSYGVDKILEGINFLIEERDKIGLVGLNGTGKSTLLKIIVGELSPDNGKISVSKDKNIGYLAQGAEFTGNETVGRALESVFDELMALESQLRALEQDMSSPNVYEDKARLKPLMERYSTLSEEFKARGGYEVQSRIRGILKGLGFDDEDTPVSNLSGGQKTRLALGRILLESPDLLLLDEPTNYLDLETTQWLEAYLKDYPKALLMVSHDRYFLDSIANKIFELENHKISIYNGNYTEFMKKKQSLKAIQEKHEMLNQKEVERLKKSIETFISHRNYVQADSRRKRLAEVLPKTLSNKDKAPIKVKFHAKDTSGREVLKIHELFFSYGKKPILENVSLDVFRGERIGIIGPNGIGKSTLLRVLAGELPPQAGNIKFGTRVKPAYFSQEQQELSDDATILDEVWDVAPTLTLTQIRTFLGGLLFSGDEVEKNIGMLSGGEKSRVALAKAILQGANLLLLDEPTNHLDIISKEKLEQALRDFNGTIIAVSHDRYFLTRIADRIWEFDRGFIRDVHGDYNYFLEKKAEREKPQVEEVIENKTELKKARYIERREREQKRQEEQRIKELESAILKKENEIEKLEGMLCEPEVYANPDKAREVNTAYNNLLIELEQLYEQLDF